MRGVLYIYISLFGGFRYHLFGPYKVSAFGGGDVLRGSIGSPLYRKALLSLREEQFSKRQSPCQIVFWNTTGNDGNISLFGTLEALLLLCKR